MKKFLAGTLFGVLISTSSVAFASYGNVFTDIASDAWYSSAANDLYARGILTGYSDGSLKPDNNINRAETAVMMDRLMADVDLNFQAFPEGQEDGDGPNYYICQASDGQENIGNQERIYEKTSAGSAACDANNCTTTFYDNTGTYLDIRSAGSQDPVIQTEDCILTTKEYFEEKVSE